MAARIIEPGCIDIPLIGSGMSCEQMLEDDHMVAQLQSLLNGVKELR